MDTSRITSRQNPQIKHAVKLRNRRHRDQAQQMLIEGFRCIRRALDSGYAPQVLYVCPELFLGDNEDQLIADASGVGCQIVEVDATVFPKIAYRDRPEGLVAIGPQLAHTLTEISLSERTILLVAEGLEKPGNLGTLLRSADAAGAAAVVLSDGVTDLHNPNVVRASTGTLFRVPVIESSNQDVFDYLRANTFQIVAATPHAEPLLWEAAFSDRVAIVVGSEQYGLTSFWETHSDVGVRIPMQGMADSLNVSTATTLMLYEAVRQLCGYDK